MTPAVVSRKPLADQPRRADETAAEDRSAPAQPVAPVEPAEAEATEPPVPVDPIPPRPEPAAPVILKGEPPPEEPGRAVTGALEARTAAALERASLANLQEPLAGAVEARRAAAAAGARRMLGSEETFETGSGKQKGEVVLVDDDGITILTRVVVGHRVMGEARKRIPWEQLAAAETERLAGDWIPAGAEGHVTRALLALHAADLDAAEAAAAQAGDHRLAVLVRRRVDALRNPPHEVAAREAWRALTSGRQESLEEALTRLAGFEMDHGGTRCFAEHKAEFEGLRDKVYMDHPEYLADLSPAVDHAFWFSSKSYRPPASGSGLLELSGMPVCVGGVVSPNGLLTHPASSSTVTVTYRIGGRYRLFAGMVALNDSRPSCASPLTLSIAGDGDALWTSKPVTGIGQQQEFSVGVRGVQVLELRVKCPGSYGNAHAVWFEPRLIGEPPASSQPRPATSSRSTSSRPPR
jgi:hypothetical protein